METYNDFTAFAARMGNISRDNIRLVRIAKKNSKNIKKDINEALIECKISRPCPECRKCKLITILDKLFIKNTLIFKRVFDTIVNNEILKFWEVADDYRENVYKTLEEYEQLVTEYNDIFPEVHYKHLLDRLMEKYEAVKESIKIINNEQDEIFY